MISVADTYLETQVQTASAERLHQMVVDAAIRFARQGAQALDQQKFDAASAALSRSRACVSEILGCIRTEPNPALAEQLRGLFAFVHRNLVLADLKHDRPAIDDALRILEQHRQTWLELTERLQQERATDHDAIAEDPGERSWTS